MSVASGLWHEFAYRGVGILPAQVISQHHAWLDYSRRSPLVDYGMNLPTVGWASCPPR